MSKIDFLAFGGLDEKQNPCYSLTIDGDIYIINCGISLPTSAMLGIKKVIPDYSWIIDNKNSVKGIFIGNANYINFGGLEYLYKYLPNIPIYTNDIAASIIQTYFKTSFYGTGADFNFNIKILEPFKPQRIGKAIVSTFKVSSYTPHSNGFIFDTKDGSIVYVDDFVVSSTNGDLFSNDYFRLNQVIENKCIALIVGCGLVGESKGFTYPNANVLKYFTSVLHDNPNNRVIVSCYDYEIYRILALLSTCAALNRPVMISGKNFYYTFKHLTDSKRFNIKSLKIITESALEEYPNVVILLVDSLEKYFSRLQKTINGQDPKLILQPSDAFIYANNTLFGYEKVEANLIDNIHRLNLQSILKLPKDILPLKASNEDHKFLINAIKPKFLIPVNGLHMNLEAYKKCAMTLGFNKSNILLLDNGEKVSFDNGGAVSTKRFIKLIPQFINAQGSLDDESSSIFERDQMKENGAILVSLLINDKDKQILKYNFDAVGVLNLTDQNKETVTGINEELVTNINKYTKAQLEANSFDVKELKQYIRKVVNKQYDKKFSKKPLVVTTLMFKK